MKLRFRCPYCGKLTHPYENWCCFCEHDISEHRKKLEKPRW